MFKIYLCGDSIYSCSACRTHLAKHDQIVSKAFQVEAWECARACLNACAAGYVPSRSPWSG